MCHRCALVCHFRILFVFLSVCRASFFRISLRNLCRRLLARLTSATKFVYFENRDHESSSRGAPLRTVDLHAMYGTVHRALTNRYTHRVGRGTDAVVKYCTTLVNVKLSAVVSVRTYYVRTKDDVGHSCRGIIASSARTQIP
jgi:hypothetical protein